MPTGILLSRNEDSDRWGKQCVYYALQFQLTKITLGNPIEYFQRRTGLQVKIGWARSPDFPNYITFTMRSTLLVADLQDKIRELREQFNNIWFHPLMPGGMEQIEKAKSHFK